VHHALICSVSLWGFVFLVVAAAVVVLFPCILPCFGCCSNFCETSVVAAAVFLVQSLPL